jgi:antitoxin Phd
MADAALAGDTWELEDAGARLSEVVRRARSEGPQRVTVRGEDAAVVVSAEEFERMRGPERTGADLLKFLQSLDLWEVVPERDKDTGRDIELPW